MEAYANRSRVLDISPLYTPGAKIKSPRLSPVARVLKETKKKKEKTLSHCPLSSPLLSSRRKESTWPVIKRFCSVLLRAVNATKICWVGVTCWPRGRGRELIRAKVRGGDDDVELDDLFYSCYLFRWLIGVANRFTGSSRGGIHCGFEFYAWKKMNILFNLVFKSFFINSMFILSPISSFNIFEHCLFCRFNYRVIFQRKIHWIN